MSDQKCRFSWTVPDVSGPDYDLSHVAVPALPEAAHV
jgi:hypothetical protein